jgi:S-(hydroxymethyl)glutathione dehydrogenase / alcohol dehydrogenase
MKAAVCREFGKPLTIEDVDLDSPQVGEVRVQVKACGICQSDTHSLEGAWGGVLPAIFGHEAAGVVEAVGDGVDELRPGQRVVVTLVRACRQCYFCNIGQPALCETTFRLDRETPLRAADGTPVTQGIRTGAFAEAVLVDASQAIPIPDDIPVESAALLACAVLTGFGAVVNRAGVQLGTTVVVIGTGGVGLNAIQGAALSGARLVIAVDIDNRKLEVARAFGATDAINPREEDAEASIAALTAGRRADTVVVTAGSGAAVEQGIKLTRRAGTVVLVGMPPSGNASRFDPGQVAHDGQRILGSKLGSAQPQIDIPRLLRLYRDRRLKLDELVSKRYPLDDINEAIASSTRGEAIRNVIIF